MNQSDSRHSERSEESGEGVHAAMEDASSENWDAPTPDPSPRLPAGRQAQGGNAKSVDLGEAKNLAANKRGHWP